MCRVFVGAVLALWLPMAAGAAEHRPRIFPNSSLTIFSIAEGPDGLMWLATSDGLYRYDGFHYHKIISYPFSAARFVGFTRDGSLWCGGFEGLARTRNGRFETVLNEEVQAMAIYPDKLFVALGAGMARIGLDGSLLRLHRRTRRDLNIDSTGRLWGICLEPMRACSVDPNRPEAEDAVELPHDAEYGAAARDSRGRIWAAVDERATAFENGKPALTIERQSSHENMRRLPLLPGRNGQLWFVGETIRGLTPPVELRDRKDHDRFAPISGLEDSRGRFWVGAQGLGLVEWTLDPGWQRWPVEDFAGEAQSQMLRDSRNSLVVATQKNLYRHDPASKKWLPLTKEERRYDSVAALDDGGFLASVRSVGVVRLTPDGKIVEHLSEAPAEYQAREIVRDTKSAYWVSSKRVLFRLEGRLGALHLERQHLPEAEGPPGGWEQPVDLELDSRGRLWAGYQNGIACLEKDGQWRKLATDRPVTMVRSFALAGDDIWIAHRRSGAFSRLHRNGDAWKLTEFSAKAGYGPADTYFMKRDSRGWIWRGTRDGVFISDGRRVAPEDWIHLNTRNGLATGETGQYGFFEDSDGAIWIGGEEGVSHIRPDVSWFQAPASAPAPQITRIEADGREFLFPAPLPAELPSDTKILRIDAGSLEAPPFREYALRYRLLPVTKEWQLSRNGSLEFAHLGDNSYSLEIGFAGDGPSAVGSYAFRVGSSVSLLLWPWAIGLVAATGVAVPVLRKTSWLDRAKFRMEKAVFLLRRRFGRQRERVCDGAAHDYSGEVLSDRYDLGRIVSRGGFSVVYEGRDRHGDGGRVAVKVLNRASGRDRWLRDRFAHEVAALRSIEHPGVVRVLDSWISPAGEPCLAMPFLNGETLRAALGAKPFTPARAARIVRQLGAALAEAHGRGIVHRDLKPENVMLLWPETAREQCVIIDFGTAGLRSGEGELAATTLLSGSFHYMAPERLTAHYSPASDEFSLAVMILEMLTGKRLADLDAIFSEPGFRSELEAALEEAIGKAAKVVAQRLAPAFDPEPRRRPTDVHTWTEEVASTLDQA